MVEEEEEEEIRLERHAGTDGDVVVVHASRGRFGGVDGEVGGDGEVVSDADDRKSKSNDLSELDRKAKSSSIEYLTTVLRVESIGRENPLNLTPPSLESLEKLEAGDTERLDLDDEDDDGDDDDDRNPPLQQPSINANDSSLS